MTNCDVLIQMKYMGVRKYEKSEYVNRGHFRPSPLNSIDFDGIVQTTVHAVVRLHVTVSHELRQFCRDSKIRTQMDGGKSGIQIFREESRGAIRRTVV